MATVAKNKSIGLTASDIRNYLETPLHAIVAFQKGVPLDTIAP